MNLTHNPDVAADIWSFMKSCGQADQLNEQLSVAFEGLRHALIEEEFNKEYLEARVELLAALDNYRVEHTPTAEARLVRAWADYADALVDSIVVLVGTFHSMGLDFKAHWNEVQRSNMAKAVDVPCSNCEGKGSYFNKLKETREQCIHCTGLGTVKHVIKRADGKILKPDGWAPPDHEPIIRSRMHLSEARNQSGQPFAALPVTPPRVKP